MLDYQYKAIRINLDKPLADLVFNYANDRGMGSLGDAIKELCHIALAAIPEDGVARAAGVRAFNEIKGWAISATVEHFRLLEKQLRETPPRAKVRPPKPLFNDDGKPVTGERWG